MKLNNQDLYNALSVTYKAVPRHRTTLPILYNAHLYAKDGKFQITTTDLDCWAQVTCPCKGDLKAITMPFAILQRAILSQSPVEINETENNRLTLTWEENKVEVATLPAAEFPVFTPMEPYPPAIGVNMDDLCEAMNDTAWAASTDDAQIGTDQKLGALYLKTEPKQFTVCATDKKVFAYDRRSAICAPAEAMIPAKNAGGLIEMIGLKDATLHLTSRYLIAKRPGEWFAVRLLEGNYFPIDRLIEQKPTFLGLFTSRPLHDALATIKLLINEPWADVTLLVSENQMEIIFKNNVHAYHSKFPMQTKAGTAATIRIDGLRLAGVLRRIGNEGLELSVLPNALMIRDGNLVVTVALLVGKEK